MSGGRRRIRTKDVSAIDMHLDVFSQVLVTLERSTLPMAQLILALPYGGDVL